MYIKTDAWYVFQNSDMHIDTIGMWTIINNGPNARIFILYKIIGEKIKNETIASIIKLLKISRSHQNTRWPSNKTRENHNNTMPNKSNLKNNLSITQ